MESKGLLVSNGSYGKCSFHRLQITFTVETEQFTALTRRLNSASLTAEDAVQRSQSRP